MLVKSVLLLLLLSLVLLLLLRARRVDSYYEIIFYEIQQLCDCVLTVLMRKHPLVTNVSSVEGGFCTQRSGLCSINPSTHCVRRILLVRSGNSTKHTSENKS